MGIGAVVGVVLVLDRDGVDHAARRPHRGHEGRRRRTRPFSDWGPVFRVDVLFVPGDGRRPRCCSTTARFGSRDAQVRRRPEGARRATTPTRGRCRSRSSARRRASELIIGSAAGNEILASLHFKAKNIEGVELNPVTLSLLTDHYASTPATSSDQPGVQPAPGRRPHVPRAQRQELRPHLVRRARQLRRQQRRVVRRVRALRELPLHEGDDRRERSSTSPTTGSWSSSSASSTSTDAPNRTARYVDDRARGDGGASGSRTRAST